MVAPVEGLLRKSKSCEVNLENNAIEEVLQDNIQSSVLDAKDGEIPSYQPPSTQLMMAY